MRITVISYDNWGLNTYLINHLKDLDHSVHHIDLSKFIYKYPNAFYKIYNFILKSAFKKNLKHIYYGNEILKRLNEKNETQDIVLTIKGDFIDPKKIIEFKKYTKKSIAFFNDSIDRCPKIKRVLSSFDEVYSFEKEDCKKNKLNFITNWIYPIQKNNSNDSKFQIFNISSEDRRSSIISKITSILKEKQINYKIIIYDKKKKNRDPNIEYRSTYTSLTDVNNYINSAQILLDINRHGQKGLTFRVFESLELEKKLITTNEDIKHYDFYNPNNILIINEKKPNIPLEFFNNEYEKISDDVLKKYTLENWIKQILKLS